MDEHDDSIPENDTADNTPPKEVPEQGEEAPPAEGDEEAGADEEVEADEASANDVNLHDELDVEAALASVVSLSEALAEHEAEEIAEAERLDAEVAAIEQADGVLREEAERRAAYYLPRPPVTAALRRGQAASAVPALLLMTVGAWLTFMLTTTDSTPTPATLVSVGLGSLGASLLAYWFTTGRWARGALFGGLSLLFLAAVIVYLSQSDDFGVEGWPLYLVAIALALLLSAFLSPPSGEIYPFTGIVLAVTGLTALAVTTDVLGEDLLNLVETLAPFILVVGLVLILLSQVPVRRG